MHKTAKRQAIWSAGAAVVLAGLPVVQRTLLLPNYLAADTQYLLALVNRVCALLLLPGKALVYKVSPPAAHYFETPGLIAASVINLILYAACLFALMTAISRLRDPRLISARRTTPNPETPELPPSPPRREFLARATGAGAGLIILGAGSYPVLIRPDWLTIRHVRVPLETLPAALSGFRIVQLTDLHHDEWISIEHVRRAVQLANSLKPDLVALTGDYVTSRGALIAPTAAELSKLKSANGVVAVLGNHDWWADADEMRAQFAAHGIPLIDNTRLFVTGDGRLRDDAEAGGICIAGVGDLWEDRVDPEQALHGVPGYMARIVLSHNPDVAEQAPLGEDRLRVDLMLSGHTHGGQVRLPFVGTPVVPSSFGQKYAHGLVSGPRFPVNISAGVGMGVLPVRLGVPPEIVVVELVSA